MKAPQAISWDSTQMSIALLILYLPSLCQGDDTGEFYNPPVYDPNDEYQDNPVYQMGQTVLVRWFTTLETYSLILWNTDSYEWIQTDMSGNTSFNWIVNTNRNLSLSNVFYFEMLDGTALAGFVFDSRYFNITPSSSSTTAQGTTPTSASSIFPPSVTSTLPQLATATQTTSTTAGSTSESTASPTAAVQPDQGGLSQEGKLGIGLGVGLGAGFLLIIAAVVWYFRRPSSRLRPATYGPSLPPEHSPYFYDSKDHRDQNPALPVEAPGDFRLQPAPFELQS